MGKFTDHVVTRLKENERAADAQLVAILADAENIPIPMRLICEKCGQLHIDEGEFA